MIQLSDLRPGFGPRAILCAIAAIAAAVWLSAIAAPDILLPSRLLFFALATGALVAAPRLFFSPVYIMAVVSGLMFSVLPSALQAILPHDFLYRDTIFTFYADRARVSVGSPSEVLVLRFAFLYLAGAAATAAICGRSIARPSELLLPPFRVLAAGAVSVTIVGLIAYRNPAAAGNFLFDNIMSAILPLASLFLVAAAMSPSSSTPRWAPVPLAVIVCGALMVATGNMKWGITVFLVVAVICAVEAQLSGKALVGAAAAAALLVTAGLIGIAHSKISMARHWTGQDWFSEGVRIAVQPLLNKLYFRQTETLYCLNGVIDRHGDQAGGSPYYFAAALVPRILWPEKPNLSMGEKYDSEYCGYDKSNTASITLLGEPLIAAGPAGLRTAEAVLFVLLAAAGFAMERSAAGRLIVAALLPWLIDFDQHFALYIAIAVKYLVLLSPFVFLMERLPKWRNRRSKETPGASS